MDEKKPTYTTEIVEVPGMRFGAKRVAVHSFVLPSGRQGRWESVRLSDKPAALLLGITAEQKIVLVRLFRFPVGDFTHELPGGNVESGESAPEAARREFLEETGYGTDEPFQELCRGWLLKDGTNGSFVVYVAGGCRKVAEPKRDEEEQAAGMMVVEKSFADIAQAIAHGDGSYDPIVSHALIALLTHQ